MSLTPALFTSPKADGTDPSKLRPSNWNRLVAILSSLFDGADASGSILLRDATDATDGASWLADVAAGSVLVSGGVGAAPAWSANPALTSLTLTAGSGTQTGKSPISIFTSTASASNVSTGVTDLISYTLPANTLAVDGQKLRITAWGTFANNANTKIINVLFGGFAVDARGSTQANVAWHLSAVVVRTGASAQIVFGDGFLGGSLNVSTNALASALNAPVTIKVTGQGGASNDITQLGMFVEWLP
jgi:hypothetical protein